MAPDLNELYLIRFAVIGLMECAPDNILFDQKKTILSPKKI
ncbi:MAG: hypothetical protein ACYCT9_11820 [Leptospirillum sp.]|jgi:hypothetical protein